MRKPAQPGRIDPSMKTKRARKPRAKRKPTRDPEPLIDISTTGVLLRGRWAVGAGALVVGLALAVFFLGVALDREWIVLLVPSGG